MSLPFSIAEGFYFAVNNINVLKYCSMFKYLSTDLKC
jgi:hypothetical protein